MACEAQVRYRRIECQLWYLGLPKSPAVKQHARLMLRGKPTEFISSTSWGKLRYIGRLWSAP